MNVTVPVQLATPPNATACGTTTTEVVVVDPCPRDYFDLVGNLADRSVQFQFYRRGHRALSARTSRHALWLVNFRLPDASGLEMLAMLRSRQRGETVYLVDDEYCLEHELACRAAGASLYLCKPAEAEWVLTATSEENQSW